MMKILLLITSLCFSIIIYARQDNSKLNLSPEFDGAGQKIYESFDCIYSKTLEYVNANDVITNEGMDSVKRVAISDFVAAFDTAFNPVVADIIAGKKTQPNISEDPQLKAEIDEMMNVIKKCSGDLDKMAKEFGAINRKATANMPEKAIVIHSISCVTYYSAIYWKDNRQKWDKLRNKAKKKIKK
jgi:hypothetical protein